MKRFHLLLSMVLLAGLTAPAAADFHVSGTFQYEDLPINLGGFYPPHPAKPVRLADVKVIDNSTQTVLASSATDVNGSFSFDVTDSQVRNVAILVMTKNDNVPNLNHSVTEWNGPAVHAYQGILVSGHNPSTDIDMGTVTMHYRAGAEPFNLYDIILDAGDYIASLEGGTRPSGCLIRFSLDVSPDVAYYNGAVNIGGNFGYDDTICLHEFGHYVQHTYGGFTDSPAGSHYVDDSAQDPRLSFGEGWPTFFACQTRWFAGWNLPQVYMNSTGDSTAGVKSFSYDCETYRGGSGASCEVAITACLWDYVDGDAVPDYSPGTDSDEVGYQMTRPMSEVWDFTQQYVSQPPFVGTLTYEDFHDLWIANVASPQTAELLQVEKLNNGIDYSDDAYEHDDSFATAGSYHSFEDIGLGKNSHHTTWPEGDEDWLKFQGLAGITYQIETTTMRDGADTYIELQNSGGTLLASNDNVASPTPGQPSTFENLRSKVTYVPATTQDLYVRIKRATGSWGIISKYGNWNLMIRPTSVPATYPNVSTDPFASIAVSIQQHTQTTRNLTIKNTGTQDVLTYNLIEENGPITWVSENPTSGLAGPGGQDISVITFDATNMVPGVYQAKLEIHSNDPDKPMRYFILQMEVTIPATDAGETASSLTTRLEPAAPNPFGSQTAIEFALKESGPVSLTVYDLQGREVRRLVDGVRDARVYTVAWDGRDAAGHELPSGVYFYRLDTRDRTTTRKVILSR